MAMDANLCIGNDTSMVDIRMKSNDCQYASHCARRMRDGDREEGCTRRTQQDCNPRVWRPYVIPALREITAAIVSKAFCQRCGAPVVETGWRTVRRFSPRCECGSQDIGYFE